MAQAITPGTADTPKVVEDKTRALPDNQGLNEAEMWERIDTEIEEARSAGTLVENEAYVSADKHGEV